MPDPLILIVEANEALLWGISELFHRHGWRVSAAATVAEGLERLADRPDWIMLDLAPPNGDAAEVLISARAECPEARVLVVARSADPLDRLDALHPEAVLTKPLDWSAVCRVCDLA